MKPRQASVLIVMLLAVYTAGAGARALRYENATALVGFGCVDDSLCYARQNRTLLPDSALVYRTGGYDGQFFYYMARAIVRGEIAQMDAPIFRRSRIGYVLMVLPFALAGGMALVLGLTLVPLAAHVVCTIVLHRRLVEYPWIAFAYALQPFAFKSFLLNVADGLAMDLAILGVLALERIVRREASEARRLSSFAYALLAYLLLALAFLTKETMLAAAILCAALVPGKVRNNRNTLLATLALAGAAMTLLVWWWAIGFSPRMMAERGGAPFMGLVEYARAPDAILSVRSLLVLLLFFYIAITCYYALQMVREWNSTTMRGRFVPLSVLVAMLASIYLVGAATADEYWANPANILRLFTPGWLVLTLRPLLWTVQNQKAGVQRIAGIGLCAWVILVDLLLLRDEFAGRLLDHFVL